MTGGVGLGQNPVRRTVLVGTRARVQVPATCANLGTGFDCMGLALDWYDTTEVEVVDSSSMVEVTGQGADRVPRDESHLVVRTIRDGLRALGAEAAGLHLVAHNTIPHGRGLGSSAAAIVAGFALAWALARPDEPLDLAWLDARSSAAEGHPDNATAAVHGGVVLSWMADAESAEGLAASPSPVGVVDLEAADGLKAVVFVPSFEVATRDARGVLSDQVDRRDAIVQATRSALLVHALTRDPQHLVEATRDLLHQDARSVLMESSHDLMVRLRAADVPAVISGAGPTVLALGRADQLAALDSVGHDGFESHEHHLGHGVRLV